MIEQFHLTHRWDPNRYNQCGSEWTLGIMAMKGYSKFIKALGASPSNAVYSVHSVGGGCYILTFDPAKNAIQGDAPEGSDTFQWQLGEEIAWAEIG